MSTSLHGAMKAYHSLIPKLKGSAFDDNRVIQSLYFMKIIIKKRWTLSQLLVELSPLNAPPGSISFSKKKIHIIILDS